MSSKITIIGAGSVGSTIAYTLSNEDIASEIVLIDINKKKVEGEVNQDGKHKKKSMYEILNGDAGNVVYEINLARVAGCPDPGDLFMKMWIFIHGAACMSLTGDYDLTDLQTMQLLEHSYYAFYNETTRG